MSQVINIEEMIETLDNWGRTESVRKQSELEEIITDQEVWTDDMLFYDEFGRAYSIDDLIGKEVKVNNKIITVIEN